MSEKKLTIGFFGDSFAAEESNPHTWWYRTLQGAVVTGRDTEKTVDSALAVPSAMETSEVVGFGSASRRLLAKRD